MPKSPNEKRDAKKRQRDETNTPYNQDTAESDISDLEEGAPTPKAQKSSLPQPPPKVTAPLNQKPQKPALEVDFKSLGISAEDIVRSTARSRAVFNRTAQEAQQYKNLESPNPASLIPNPISTNPQFSSLPSSSGINPPLGHPVMNNPTNVENQNIQIERMKILKADLKNTSKIIGIRLSEAEGMLNNNNLDYISGFIEGMKFCFNHSFRNNHEDIKELNQNMRKLIDNNTSLSQEIKNLRASVGTPANILKSLEKKIDEKMFVPFTPNAPEPMVVEPNVHTLLTYSQSTSVRSSAPASEASMETRPSVVLKGGSYTNEETLLLMAKDAQSFIKRGMNQNLANVCERILSGHRGRASQLVEKLIGKLRQEYNLDTLNNNTSFKNGCSSLHLALFNIKPDLD